MMSTMSLNKYLNENSFEFASNVDLKQLTGVNGGTCSYFSKPKSFEQYLGLLKFSIRNKLSFEVVGNLTNTFFLQSYNPKLIISTIQVNEMTTENEYLLCSCGCNLTKVSRYCISNGISGYEGFIGIPGTIGAAAINNSGAFSSEMSKVVKYVEVLTSENHLKRLYPLELNYKTRSSILKNSALKAFVLRVALDISQKEEVSVLESKAEEIRKLRQNTIDGKRKSLGSVFVSTSLRVIFDQHKVQTLLKRICFAPFKLFFANRKLQRINTFLDFLFLGIPKFIKHCDSLNRFCWEKDTTEKDFMDYISSMQKLANSQLKLEIDLKGILK